MIGIARLSDMRQVVHADFDRVRTDGRLIAHVRHFFPVQPEIGAHVRIVDEAEDMAFNGTITGFSDDLQRAYLTMDWEDEVSIEEFDKMWDESDPT